MNAKEIAAAYEPLWNRVPETRPRRDRALIPTFLKRYQETFVGGRSVDYFRWWDGEIAGPVYEQMEDQEALALCRCAVLEWLLANGCTLTLQTEGSGEVVVFSTDQSAGVARAKDSLDEGLIAAAMKVAEKAVKA